MYPILCKYLSYSPITYGFDGTFSFGGIHPPECLSSYV